MSFEEFIAEIQAELLKGWKEDADITICPLKKNNNQKFTGLHIRQDHQNTSPVLYLEGYYLLLKQGRSMSQVLRQIQHDYERACLTIPCKMKNPSNFAYIKDRIIFRLINFEKNKELLKDCPYVRLFDLALTFRWVAYTDDNGIASALITRQEMEHWKVTPEQILVIAKKNTPALFPARIYTLDRVLKEFGIIGEDNDTQMEMYILTNQTKINGATSLLYDNVLADFARSKRTDFYILPSSIHEVILLPLYEADSEEILFRIVKEANEKVVSLGDVLSDQIYYYRWEENRLEAVCHPGEK